MNHQCIEFNMQCKPNKICPRNMHTDWSTLVFNVSERTRQYIIVTSIFTMCRNSLARSYTKLDLINYIIKLEPYWSYPLTKEKTYTHIWRVCMYVCFYFILARFNNICALCIMYIYNNVRFFRIKLMFACALKGLITLRRYSLTRC